VTQNTSTPTFAGSSSAATRPATRRLRVLIAEDDRDSAASLEALVQLEGHETRCVHRGRAVVGVARDFGCDVVLLDIGMPGINGYDIARIFRKTYGSAGPVLIAVTAWNKSADKLMAKHAGFDHHFGKPYDPNELLAVLRELAQA
jgi:DNA-binding response OmpR family regulator